MATTNYPVNHPLAVKRWSNGLMKEALKRTWAAKYMGMDKNSVIYIKDDVSKGKGDKITYGLRDQLQGAGIQGDATLEGNEEALATFSDSIFINHLRHAVRSAGKMSEQRVPFTVRDEAMDGLADWFADRYDQWFFHQICGDTVQTDTRYTGNNATSAPSATRQFIYDDSTTTHTAESSLSESDTFKLKLIDWAVELAKTADPAGPNTRPLTPVRVGGEDFFVMFLHPYQVTDLRRDANTNGDTWQNLQRAAMSGGDIKSNPLFTGALGVYNGVILHESTRIRTGIASGAYLSNTRRAVLCGAQAVCMAYGMGFGESKMEWKEELFDYGNQLGVAVGCIAGMKKSQFQGGTGNQEDYGTIVISTYAAKHT